MQGGANCAHEHGFRLFYRQTLKMVDFSESIAACDLKICRCQQLIELMKMYGNYAKTMAQIRPRSWSAPGFATYPLRKFEISSLWLYSQFSAGHGRQPRRQVLSRSGSHVFKVGLLSSPLNEISFKIRICLLRSCIFSQYYFILWANNTL